MIILSQDRSKIFNFENAFKLIAEENYVCISDGMYDDNAEVIGIYATKERAKEVLYEIIKSIFEFKKSGELSSIFGFQTIPENTYYEMPKE